MNLKSIVYSLLFALPLPLMAASETSILILKSATAEAGKATAGFARAIVKSTGGDMSVRADDLVIEERGNLLQCSGDVTISVAGCAIKGKDLTIDLGDRDHTTIYYLNPAGIVLNPEGKRGDALIFPLGDSKAAFEAWKPGQSSPFTQSPAAKETTKP